MTNTINLSARHRRPQTLASAFGGLMRIFGRTASDADLAERWDEIMGDEISSIAKLAGIRRCATPLAGGLRPKGGGGVKFNIAIRATNPAFALQLSYMTDDIATKINKYFGYDAVAKIVIRK